MDKIRTLSAAIRYGSKLKPQSFCALFEVNRDTGQVHSCAVGAAYDALMTARGEDPKTGSPCTSHAAKELRKHFGMALDRLLIVPLQGGQTSDALTIVPYLNDGPRWTREAIADWLEENGL